ncbi:LamG domain-containing protein [Mesorhizobium sp. M4B.F.Ca.ET.190.01.1.1]|uniref:LamG domain-containing protein n=1 Tax=unclassified Mesorhizobium TaxID=325217 RepID=UPI0010920F4E|nr:MULTISPECIES: LamG domain-containing protein [unclassified Mesorhizobium]TGR05406.1 LamG domain-containing protein [Mesorhizobium sp. M4B.F.Ca.ET.200.01.1.1]TGS15662.1 LamG domain-containing protein [Mesorhizobium sp. M4B.F.Ca.ET.190.01.1.1]TGT27722.1 LamG domain-containing protein [Mesorhizobium sp. M4B.F.Ca.ET.172.01.1.1]
MLCSSGRFFDGAGAGLGSGNDPYWGNVVLLCGFEGTDGATTTSDESQAPHALTFVGNAQIDTAQSKFGGSSLLLDGTGDNVTAADSADWDLSDANGDQFTIEMWIRATVGNTTQYLISSTGSVGNWGWWFSFNDSKLRFLYSPNGTTPTTTVSYASPNMSLNAWHHVAVDKDATGKIRLYVDGAMVGSDTPANSAFFNTTAVLSIGSAASASYFNGWIDELRITKGVARYANDAGYTVPTAAFPRS